MKKIIRLFFVLGLAITIINCYQGKINAQMVIDDEIKEVVDFDLNDYTYYDEENNLKIFVSSKNVRISSGGSYLLITGKYNAHLFLNGTCYLAIDESLLKIVNNKVEKVVKLDYQIKNLIFDEFIYACGEQNGVGILKEYDTSLKEQRKLTIDYDQYNAIEYLVKEGNNFYILLVRQGPKTNGPLKNVGSFSDIKTCLLKLDKRFTLVDCVYLNLGETKETPKSLKRVGNELYFSINVNEYLETHYFKIDLALTHLEHLRTGEAMDYVMLDYNNKFIGFSFDAYLKMDADEMLYDFDIKAPIGVKLVDDELQVYAKSENRLMVYHVSEYHINKLDAFKIGYDYGNYDFSKELNKTEAVDIESHFANVSVTSLNTVNLKAAGTYDLALLVSVPHMDRVELNTKVIIDKYVNVENLHAYPVGTVLSFIGTATLDGKAISSGTTLKEEGLHHLKLTDNLQNSEEIDFYIVKDYYVANEYVKVADYYVKQNSDFVIPFSFNEEIMSIIVNDQVTDFTQNGSSVSLNMQAVNSYGLKKYVINEITTVNKTYEVNQEVSVYVLKNKPSIDIIEDDTSELALKLQVNDEDHALLYLKVKAGNEEVMNFFDNQYIDYSGTEMRIMLYYDLGDGVKEVEIATLRGTVSNADDFLEISVDKTSFVKAINLYFKTKQFTNIEKITVSSQKLNYDYTVKADYKHLYISGALTIFIIFSAIILAIKKNKKQKNDASPLKDEETPSNA